MSSSEAPGLEALHGAEAIAPALTTLERHGVNSRPFAYGWATVELERAEREVRRAFAGPEGVKATDAPDDDLLAARCRRLDFASRSLRVVLLEPSTEGRLAATLARFGEGFVALYLLVPDLDRVRAADLPLSPEGSGPFGRQRLAGGGSAWGAHLLLVTGDGRSVEAARAATIEP